MSIMKKILILAFTLMVIFASCIHSPEDDSDSESNSDSTSGVRIGAVCNDGTTSTATGSGACSHHGGVDYWLYGWYMWLIVSFPWYGLMCLSMIL